MPAESAVPQSPEAPRKSASAFPADPKPAADIRGRGGSPEGPPTAGRSSQRRRPCRDRQIMELAAGQHGVVARSQLLDAGVPDHVIEHRQRNGLLHTLHRGVYRVGPVPAPLEGEMAAVLACGKGALLTARSAAALGGLGAPRRPGEPVELLVVGRTGPRRGVGIRVRRVRALPDDERRIVHGIPATSPARTLLEIAATRPPREAEQALATAPRAGLVTWPEIRTLLERYPRGRGTRLLRELTSTREGPSFSRSEAEDRFADLIRRARLRKPETNRRVHGYEVDFFWPEAKLIVEIDGFRYHRGTAAFERDRRRDVELRTAGYTVLRFTWQALTKEREYVAARVSACLALAGVFEAP